MNNKLGSFDSFDNEDEVGVGWDRPNGSVSVSGVRRTEHFYLLVEVELHSDFIPALDDLSLSDSDVEGLSSIVAGVELGAIDESAIVVHGDCIAGIRLSACFTCIYDLNAVLLHQFGGEFGEGAGDESS